jgi:hypothetical protein
MISINFLYKIIFLLFFNFIFFIIYITHSKDNLISELVSKKYYEEEIKYQNIIKYKENALSIKDKIKIKRSKIGIEIIFPYRINYNYIKIILFRSSDKKLDLNKKFFLSKKNNIVIPTNKLKYGMYRIIIFWKNNNKKFLIEKSFFLKKKI